MNPRWRYDAESKMWRVAIGGTPFYFHVAPGFEMSILVDVKTMQLFQSRSERVQ